MEYDSHHYHLHQCRSIVVCSAKISQYTSQQIIATHRMQYIRDILLTSIILKQISYASREQYDYSLNSIYFNTFLLELLIHRASARTHQRNKNRCLFIGWIFMPHKTLLIWIIITVCSHFLHLFFLPNWKCSFVCVCACVCVYAVNRCWKIISIWWSIEAKNGSDVETFDSFIKINLWWSK